MSPVIHLPETDVLLIGAGPIGLETAAALKLGHIPYLHVEAGAIASTIAWYAPGTQIFSSPERLAIAGVPFLLSPQVRATREDYLNYLRTVAALHKLEIHSYRRVVVAHSPARRRPVRLRSRPQRPRRRRARRDRTRRSTRL